MFENKVSGRVLGPKKEEVTGRCRTLDNEV
jgi:hypothetical protein